ncbi:MAG: amidohydrolase [Betaproteobacteria bacterium]|nr:MAG: amidohydrolase [Betaproteobacteria bacterium]
MRIDVHHHLFPPAYIASLVESEHYLARGVARQWTPQVSLEDMDAADVATAITSITAPGFAIVAPELRFKLNRECNEYGARMALDHRGRFGLFASLPLPDVERSLEEIGYALDTLKADGIGLLTSYGNKWLGDPAFAPVMAELDRRKCVVYVHPTAPDCCRNLLPGVPDWVIEFPADTMRTIASLLFSGTVERCRNIRFIFAHVGGVLPLLTEHLVRAAQFDVRSELKKFHYDTALRAHPVGVFSALQVVGVSQLLFGTDAPLRRSIDQVTGLRSCGLSEDELRKIDYENARRLLNSSTFAFGGALHADQ